MHQYIVAMLGSDVSLLLEPNVCISTQYMQQYMAAMRDTDVRFDDSQKFSQKKTPAWHMFSCLYVPALARAARAGGEALRMAARPGGARGSATAGTTGDPGRRRR